MKRSVLMAMAVLMVAALAACNRGERATITGSYGEAVVSGQITMADGLGSPAGVEVTVRGTGMTAVLADDGRFTFAGVPSNAAFDFRRASDGITATLAIPESQGFVHLSLAKNEARSMKRRGGENVIQIEGIVRSISATELVLAENRRGEKTVRLTAATVIRKGDTVLTPAEVQVGWRVHVKATRAENVYTAVQVIVQNTRSGEDDGGEDEGGHDDAPPLRQFEGTVRTASATSLVFFTSRREELTFVINAQTEIRKGNDRLTAADLKPEMRVHVKARVDGSTNTAVWITVQKAK